jgi:hypothetical protein
MDAREKQVEDMDVQHLTYLCIIYSRGRGRTCAMDRSTHALATNFVREMISSYQKRSATSEIHGRG